MKILVIDIGGTHVKVLASGRTKAVEISSGPRMTPAKMAAAVRAATIACRAGPDILTERIADVAKMPPNMASSRIGSQDVFCPAASVGNSHSSAAPASIMSATKKPINASPSRRCGMRPALSSGSLC